MASAAARATLRDQVATIAARDRRRASTLMLTSGVTVIWGDPAESALKADIVTALLKRKPKTDRRLRPHNPAIR